MPNKRLEELRKKKAELIKKRENRRKQKTERIKLTQSTSVQKSRINQSKITLSKSEARKNINLTISSEFMIYLQKKEKKKMMLDEQVYVTPGDIVAATKEIEDSDESDSHDTSSESDSDDDEVNKLDIILRDHFDKRKTIKEKVIKEYKIMDEEGYNNFLGENETSFTSFLQVSEKRLKKEMDKQSKISKLIEDYINNQDKDIQEQRGGCTVRKIENHTVEGSYMANDLIWLNNKLEETEKIAVSFCRFNANKRENNLEKKDYILNIYTNDKKIGQKQSRSNIKKIAADEDTDEFIWGGMENGRIAVWDLRTNRNLPNLTSLVSEKSNFLPIIDIKKKDNFLYTVGLEGRFCKWDPKKLEQPIIYKDLFCKSDNQNIARLEAMPLGFDIESGDANTIYINTAEGSIYEMLLTPNSLQQRSLFSDLHTAPIIKFQTIDFKNYFRKNATKKIFNDLKPCSKYSNFFVSCSFDWNIKIWKYNMTDSKTIKFHNDFVTALDVNNNLSPFCFASGDSEGKVAVWKLGTGNSDAPIFDWDNNFAISKLCWNSVGNKLGISDVNGGINVITFPRSKLMLGEDALKHVFCNDIKNLKGLK